MASPVREGGGVVTLFAGTITTAGTVTGGTVPGVGGVVNLISQARLVYGSGGTNVKSYLQTSLDGGSTWIDMICNTFTTSTASKVVRYGVGSGTGTATVTPTDGSLTDDTVANGIIGDRFRVKVISTGTYAGTTTLTVTAALKGA